MSECCTTFDLSCFRYGMLWIVVQQLLYSNPQQIRSVEFGLNEGVTYDEYQQILLLGARRYGRSWTGGTRHILSLESFVHPRVAHPSSPHRYTRTD